jgi:hypothetical protein
MASPKKSPRILKRSYVDLITEGAVGGGAPDCAAGNFTSTL